MLHRAQRQADGEAPSFEAVFAAAESQARGRRRLRFAGLTAAAIAVLAFGLLPTEEDEFTYVDVEELKATTYWIAPSDSLLPVHEIDIYRELPNLFESTEPDGGTLL
jgi:hypothetical protein